MDQSYGTRQQTHPDRSLFLETTFHSLKTTACLQATIQRSTFPVYLFGTSLNCHQARSVF